MANPTAASTAFPEDQRPEQSPETSDVPALPPLSLEEAKVEFEDFYKQRWKHVWLYFRYKDVEDKFCEDFTSNLFFKLYRAYVVECTDAERAQRLWVRALWTAANNRLADHWDQVGTKERPGTRGTTISLDQDRETPGQTMTQVDAEYGSIHPSVDPALLAAMRICFEQLSQPQRQCFALKYAGYGRREIAAMLGFTENQVHERLKEAYAHFRVCVPAR